MSPISLRFRKNKIPPPKQAYLVRPAEGRAPDGWTYGRPPGILPVYWPRSRMNGLPMAHIFTLRLPEEYRVRGPEIVGLSFFQADDHVGTAVAGVAELLDGDLLEKGDSRLNDPFWRALQAYALGRHPRERYLEDEIAGGFALLWLTEADYRGEPCPLPEPEARPERNSTYDGMDAYSSDQPADMLALEPYDDPNVGRTPQEDFTSKDDYIPPYTDEGDALGLEMVKNHLGGTCYPSQTLPDGLSPFYLDIEHGFGGLNVGGGNGQLDLLNETWEWSCG